jgi:hypothetical protein
MEECNTFMRGRTMRAKPDSMTYNGHTIYLKWIQRDKRWRLAVRRDRDNTNITTRMHESRAKAIELAKQFIDDENMRHNPEADRICNEWFFMPLV